MKLQLKPGDYVSTKGMTEDQYHAVCRRFIECGCPIGEHSEDRAILHYAAMGWANNCEHLPYNNKFFHGLENGFKGKLYTVEQILSSEQEIWNGTGLPPVGTECEIYPIHTKAKITYMGNGVGCYIDLSNGLEFSIATCNVTFRPIKSDREKAIDEMYSTLENTASMSYKQVAEKLYDAGYRNPNKMIQAIIDADSFVVESFSKSDPSFEPSTITFSTDIQTINKICDHRQDGIKK